VDPNRTEYRCRWFERLADGTTTAQSHRFKNQAQVLRFLNRLLAEQPGTHVIIERRVHAVGPWEPVDVRKDGAK
jgi:hypothetical protein